MATRTDGFSRLDVRRREQTPQALARLVVVALFVGLWFLLWLARMPMPFPFLCVLLAEIGFFLVYWRTVFLLRSVRAVEIAHYVMLAAEIVFHTTIVYFLGGISWLGSFAYVFGLIFTNTFLDLRRGLIYTGGASLAFGALIMLDATGTVPHYVYLEQGALRYSDPRFVATTMVAAGGVFFSIYAWVNWVGRQLRVERDAAVRAQDGLLDARTQLQRANEALEERVLARTSELERANSALKESEERFRRISDNAPDVIYRYRLRPTFTCEYMSPASITITGYSPAEYYIDPMLGLTTVHPDDRELLQDAFLGGTDEPLTVRCVRKDGAIIWAEQRFVAVYDREGNVIAIEGIARDITGRRHAEEALRDSEQRLNLVVETSPDLIAIQERNGRYTFVNSAYRTVLGYQPEDLIGLNPADFIHADDLEDVSQRFNDMLQSGRPGKATFRFRHHDGRWVTLEGNGQVLADESGQATGVVVVSRDVTERKQAEAALRESEERYRSLAENTFDLICEAGADGRFSYLSPNYSDVVGYEPEELLGNSIFDLMHPDDRPAVVSEFARAINARTSGQAQFRYRHKNGEWRWFESAGKAFQTGAGELRVVVVSRDVTERKQAEAALRESEERQRTLIEGAGAILWEADAVTWRFTFVSRQAETILGYPVEEWSEQDFWVNHIHPDDRDSAAGFCMRATAEGRDHEFDYRMIAKDGRAVWLHDVVRVIQDESGTARQLRGIMLDVTQRKATEEALRQSEDVLRATIESTADGIVVFDDHARLLHFNSQFASMWGIPPHLLEAREGRALSDFVKDQLDDPEEFMSRTRQVYATSEESADVLFFKDGRVFDRFSRPLLQGDQPVGRVWSFRDVTERLRAEEALRESEERFRRLAENAADIIFRYRLLPVPCYEYVSPAVTSVLGYSPEEVYANSGLGPAIVHPDDLEGLGRLSEASAAEPLVLRFFHRNGSLVWLEFRTVPTYGDEGELVAIEGIARDITERKRAEQFLRETEERFRKIFEEGPLGMAIVTPELKTLRANSTLCRMLGYSEQELTLLTFSEITHPDDLEKDLGLAQQLLAGEIPSYKVEKRYVRKDGGVLWATLTASVIRNEDGTPLYGLGMIEDITERRRQEEALEALRRHNTLILNSAGEGIFGLSLEGRTTFVNPTAGKLLGWPAEDLIGQRQHDVIHHSRHDGTRYPVDECPIYAALRDGRVHQVADEVFWRRDGTSFPVEYLSTPIRDERDEIVGAVVTFRDITERKRQDEALRESESKFRTMTETVAAAAFIFQGDRMRYVNSAAEAITGYSRRDLLAMNFWDVIHPDDRDLVRKRGLARQRGEHAPPRYEVRVLTKGGAERWVDFTAGMIDFDGAPAVLGTAFDITERKRAEDALREQARRDPLTGLLNHAAIVDELRELIARGGPAATHAVAMVDVDGLKAVNDTFGHQIGDLVLLTVARALTREGAAVGRYGGDEFVALLKGRDRAGAERYRNAVVEAVTGARLKDPETGATVPVVVSMGLAIYPEEAESIEELIKLSDSAMYAWRRHRPIVSGEPRPSGPLPGARAAEMIGELVPLLTSPGDLSDKFRAVAHRLSVGAGYDAVNFALFAGRPGPPLAANTFARVADELVEAWNDDQRANLEEPHPIRLFFEQNPLPVIMDDPWNDQRLLESQRTLLRTAGFRSVLVAPMLWHGEVVGSLGVANQQEHAFSSRDAQFLAAVATQLTAIVRMATLVDELQSSAARLSDAQTETVMLLASVAEARDRTTGRHLQNVRALTEALARELGYDEDAVRELGLAAVLHDIGKIRVPDAVLGNTEQLRPDEWELIRRHTSWGAELLAGRPGFELAAIIAHSHHERWDGTGYPAGLAGDALPQAAAIVAVADAFDAIIDSRPYSKGRSVAHAVREIAACAGKQFSPQVVDALLRLYEEHRLPGTARARRAA